MTYVGDHKHEVSVAQCRVARLSCQGFFQLFAQGGGGGGGGGQNEIVWIIRGEGQAKAKEGQMPTPP